MRSPWLASGCGAETTGARRRGRAGGGSLTAARRWQTRSVCGRLVRLAAQRIGGCGTGPPGRAGGSQGLRPVWSVRLRGGGWRGRRHQRPRAGLRPARWADLAQIPFQVEIAVAVSRIKGGQVESRSLRTLALERGTAPEVRHSAPHRCAHGALNPCVAPLARRKRALSLRYEPLGGLHTCQRDPRAPCHVRHGAACPRAG